MSGQAVFASTQLEGAATRRVAQVQEVKDLAQDCSIVICLMDPYIPLCYIMTFISFHILCNVFNVFVYTQLHTSVHANSCISWAWAGCCDKPSEKFGQKTPFVYFPSFAWLLGQLMTKLMRKLMAELMTIV